MGVSGPKHPEGDPNPATSLLGHDREVAEVTELLARRPQPRAPATSRTRLRLSVERV
jgi:hypothetical protein